MNHRSANHHGVLTPQVTALRAQVGATIVRWIRQQGLSNVKVGEKMKLGATDVASLLESNGQQFTLERLLRILTGIGGSCELLIREPSDQAGAVSNGEG